MEGGTRSITVTLKSGDGEVFKVSEVVARQSQTIRFMMEPDDDGIYHQDVNGDVFVPLPNVSTRILAKVIKYCKWKVGTPAHASEGEKRKWEKQFVDVDQKTIFELIHAANYMEIEELLDLTCAAVADMIRGKSPEEIRRIFGIKNDLTPVEVEEIRRENEWALD